MPSLLLSAILHLGAGVLGKRLPPPSICADQLPARETDQTSSLPGSATRKASSESTSQGCAALPAAQVSNSSARAVPTSLDHQHCVHDATQHCSPHESRDSAVHSAAQNDAFPTSGPANFTGSPLISRTIEQNNRKRYGRHEWDEDKLKIERMGSELFGSFCYSQTVVIGNIPTPVPRGKVFVVSPRANVPPRCFHVCCEPHPEEWPVALALTGFDWRQSTVWLLRVQDASESDMLQQLKAIEMMSAPCSVVILLSSSERVRDIVDGAGFCVDETYDERPLFLLRKKELQPRCFENHAPSITPQYSPPPEPDEEGLVVRFELCVNSLPEQVRHGMATGCTRIVGNCPELGVWDVDSGVRLVIAEDVLLAEVLVGKGETEYKYVFVDATGNVLWEDGGNRRLSYVDQTLLRLEEHWRGY